MNPDKIHRIRPELLYYAIPKEGDPAKQEFVLEWPALKVNVKGSTPGAALEKFGNALKGVKKETWEKALML